MKVGEVYYHEEFPFPDTTTGKKLFIVVHSSIKTVFVCKTTSQEKRFYREKIPGCNPEKNYFMLLANEDWFKKDTWVDLKAVEINKISLLKSKLEKDHLRCLNTLKNNTIKEILKCIILSEDDPNLSKFAIQKSLEAIE